MVDSEWMASTRGDEEEEGNEEKREEDNDDKETEYDNIALYVDGYEAMFTPEHPSIKCLDGERSY